MDTNMYFNLTKLEKFTAVFVNSKEVPLIGIIDIIIEAGKPLVIQLKRADTNGDTIIEELEPKKATLERNRLYIELKPFSKPKILKRIPFTPDESVIRDLPVTVRPEIIILDDVIPTPKKVHIKNPEPITLAEFKKWAESLVPTPYDSINIVLKNCSNCHGYNTANFSLCDFHLDKYFEY